MSTQWADPKAIIVGLKLHFGVESDEALSQKLGVAKSTIATWRRRGIPTGTRAELEANHGLTLANLVNENSDKLREYVLRQAYYFVILGLYRVSLESDQSPAHDANFADSLALIEPYLKRAIVRAASDEKYRGVTGSAAFLFDLRAGVVKASALAADASTERRKDL